MKYIWKYVEKKKWLTEKKYRVILLILGALYAFAGLVVWLIIRNWVLSSWDWLICFIGYPIFLSRIVVFLYSCNHEFNNGNY